MPRASPAEITAAIGSTPSGIARIGAPVSASSHRERIVRGERNDRESSAVGAGARGDRGRAGHVVAERA